MAFATVGLKTYVWNNNLKSIILLTMFPVLICSVSWGIILLTLSQDQNTNVAEICLVSFKILLTNIHVPLIITLVWFLFAYAFNSKIIEKITKEKLVERKDEPRVYNILENLCISIGASTPKLSIIDSPALNAYASGISDKSYRITLTKGIIEKLDDKELEAVMAHELTHIINKDVRLLVISTIFVGIISVVGNLVGDIFFRRTGNSLLNSQANKQKIGKINLISLAIGLALIFVSYLLSICLTFAISRKREYLADAGSVELTKNPESLISALEKISGNSTIEKMPRDIAQMCIDNKTKFDVFSTHPSIEERISAIRSIS